MSEVSEKLFYVRARGRVSGPFNMPALAKMLRRGSLSAVDELSENQIEWTRASQFEALFPKRAPTFAGRSAKHDQAEKQNLLGATAQAPMQHSAHRGDGAGKKKDDSSSRTGEDDVLYNYAQRGVMIGPVSESVLRSLAENGTLRPDDAVWSVGSTSCVEARQLIFLATAFFGQGGLKSGGQGSRSQRGDESDHQTDPVEIQDSLKRSHKRVSRYVLIAAICWVALALFSLHLPFGVADSKATGWWSLAQASEAPKLATGTIISVGWHFVACIGIVLVASLMRGIFRAIALICLGVAAEIPLIVICMFIPTFGWALFIVAVIFIIPISASGLAAVLRARRTAATNTFASGLQGTFAAVMGLSTLLVLITSIAVLLTLPDMARLGEVVGFVVGLVLIFLSLLSLFAGSIMGLVALKPKFTPGVHLVGAICIRVGLALLVSGIVIISVDTGEMAIVFAGAMNNLQNGQQQLASLVWLTIIGRLAVLCLFAPAVVALGLEELANELVVTRRLRQDANFSR